MQSQLLRRKCDSIGCNSQMDFEIQKLTPQMESAMGDWITIAREVVVQGQVVPIIKHACNPTCAYLILKEGLPVPPKGSN